MRGRLVEAGWGAAFGYPGLVLDVRRDVIEVELFQLRPTYAAHWPRLDAFEGPGYRRVTVVGDRCRAQRLPACIYVLAQ